MKTYIFPLRFDTLKSALCQMSYNQWVRDCRRILWREVHFLRFAAIILPCDQKGIFKWYFNRVLFHVPNFMTLYVFTLLAGFSLLLACLPYIHKDIWSLCVVDLKTRWGLSGVRGVSLRDCVWRWAEGSTWLGAAFASNFLLSVARGTMALKRLMNSFGITFVGKMNYKCVALRRAFCYLTL